MIQEVKNIFNSFIPALDSREKKIVVGAAVVAGIAAVCFGLYYAGSSLPSFSMYSRATNKEIDQLFPPASCKERIKEGKKLFFSCPATKVHWEEVESKGKINIKCKPHVLVQSGGEADFWTRTISISDQISTDKITDILLFESRNLKNPFKPTRKFVCSKTPDEYVEWVEREEYKTVLDTQTICSQCIRERDTGQIESMWIKLTSLPLMKEETGITLRNI